MTGTEDFTTLARRADAPLDRLALTLAAQFRPVDAGGALRRLDALGAELGEALGAVPREGRARALVALLARRHGFHGEYERQRPEDAMLDVVLERRCGPPELLAVVYEEVARRAGLAVWGVGLPGHFVVACADAEQPVVLDPCRGCELPPCLAPAPLRPCSAHDTMLRVLDTLVAGYARAVALDAAIRAAELRLALPAERARRVAQRRELIALRARLN